VDPKILTVAGTIASSHEAKSFLASLNTTTETLKQPVATANTLAGQVDHRRILVNLQLASHPVSGLNYRSLGNKSDAVLVSLTERSAIP
jgi:hypothetical protein